MAGEVDLDMFGKVEASVWTQSAMSEKGTSAEMSRYAYAEIDYLLRYYYDIDIAEGWRLRNGVGRRVCEGIADYLHSHPEWRKRKRW